MASLSLQDRQGSRGGYGEPINIIEVMDAIDAALTSGAAAEGQKDAGTPSLAKVSEKSQSGMDPFYFVRAFQGKLTPSREVSQRAVARALLRFGGGRRSLMFSWSISIRETCSDAVVPLGVRKGSIQV